MKCEICGERKAVKKVNIEGATLWVCEKCGGGLPEVKAPKIKPIQKEVIEEVVENYGSLIRQAMEKEGISEDELAKELGEKLSFLKRVLKQEVLPPNTLLKKLERRFGIKLLTQHTVTQNERTKKIEEASLAEFSIEE